MCGDYCICSMKCVLLTHLHFGRNKEVCGGVWKVKVCGRCVEGEGVWKGRYCNASKGHVDYEPRKGLLILSPKRAC